ncbi:Bro-N domain-containing protein, partial [Candidatus Uhrbacteria bacterium]|nr:Bro-N domain-containing protein [Candidatus Uhrbacteria bacterium]
METKIAIFRGKEVRKVIHNNEWWFSIHDIVGVLTDSNDSRGYFDKVLQRDAVLKSTYGQFVRRLPLFAMDGRIREQICANTEGIFRIIQSIPSPKAEPLKRWLAKTGYERIQEIEDPE